MPVNDAGFMREALAEARLAGAAGEMPVGCVIVRDGKIVARAHNECEARLPKKVLWEFRS